MADFNGDDKALRRLLEADKAVLTTWQALQDYKGDEMFKPIDAFRAAMAEMRAALGEEPTR